MRPASSSSLYHPLDAVLSSPALVRVARVMATHGGPLTVADIADRARLTLPSVRLALRRLTQLDLVATIGPTRSALNQLRREHPLAPSLIELFRAERVYAEKLFESLRQAALPISNSIAAVWVFGSAARGTDTPDSDIDVALVTYADPPSPSADAYREELARVAPEWARRVSVVTLTPKQARLAAKERTRFWREIERDAVVVDGDAPSVFRYQARTRRKVAS